MSRRKNMGDLDVTKKFVFQLGGNAPVLEGRNVDEVQYTLMFSSLTLLIHCPHFVR